MRRLLLIAGILVGILVVAVVGLEIFLNSARFRKIVDDAVSESVQGELRYSNLHFTLIKSFPRIAAEVDSLSVTYPHGLFAEYDGVGIRHDLLDAGRGEREDTLLAFRKLRLAVNPWRLLGGTIRVNEVSLDSPKVFLHAYTQDASNLDIFPSSPDTTASEPSSLPWISVGKLGIAGEPLIVYTSQADTVYAHVAFEDIFLKGKARIKADIRESSIKGLDFGVDSLMVEGRLPADTLSLSLKSLTLATPGTNLLDLGLDADVHYMSPSLGALELPVRISSLLGFKKESDNFLLDLRRLEAEMAHIPLNAGGQARLYGDRTYIDAEAGIRNCDLGRLLSEYAHNFSSSAGDVWTDAVLDVSVGARGNISPSEYPAVDASIRIPESKLKYYPEDYLARLSLDVAGKLTPDMHLSADVNELRISSDPLTLQANGRGTDLLGRNAAVDAHMDAVAFLEKLVRFFPEGLFAASGKVNLNADVDAVLSELEDFKFRRSRIDCGLSADRIDARLVQSGMSAHLRRPDIRLGNDASGLVFRSNADSLAFDGGSELTANIRKFNLDADIDKVEVDGKLRPRAVLSSDDGKIFVRSGDTKIRLKNASIGLEAAKRGSRPSARGGRSNHRIDSLRRLHPGIPKDSLFKLAGVRRRRLDDFAAKDFRFDLDSSLVGLLDTWKPSGMIAFEKGVFINPSLPLRTRINTFNVALDDDEAKVVAFDASCGSTDLKLDGGLAGFRRFLRNRGPLKFDLNLNSDRFNLNELLLAMQKAQGDTLEVSGSETDESFVVDSLANAEYEGGMEMKAFVVPRNLRGSLNLNARQIEYKDIKVSPAVGQINIGKRVLQVREFKADTNIGSMDIDAYYASKSRDDISVGLDMHLNNMPAYDIIHMLPAVDGMMPAVKSFQGNMDFVVAATAQLDTNLNIVPPSVNGLARIAGEDLYVKNAGSLRKITRLLFFKNKNIGEIRNLYVDAVVCDEKAEVYPFVLGVDKYTLALSGTQHFNNKLSYRVSVLESIIPFRFGIRLRGSLDNWRFSLGRSQFKGVKRVPSYAAQLDTTEMNILYSIRNVLENGVDKVASRSVIEKLLKEKADRENGMGADGSYSADSLMSNEEFYQLDSMLLAMQMQEDSVEVFSEIDDILERSLNDIEFLQAEWEATHPWEAKAIRREEERLIEKSRKEAKKEE